MWEFKLKGQNLPVFWVEIVKILVFQVEFWFWFSRPKVVSFKLKNSLNFVFFSKCRFSGLQFSVLSETLSQFLVLRSKFPLILAVQFTALQFWSKAIVGSVIIRLGIELKWKTKVENQFWRRVIALLRSALRRVFCSPSCAFDGHRKSSNCWETK